MRKLIGIWVLTFLMACNPSTPEGLQLNQGERWEVNTEMKIPIARAETMLSNYLESETGDYLSLAKGLKEHNQELIRSCTMKGAEHEALHLWLHPHMKLIQNLEAATTPKEAQSLINTLKESFQTYHQYFE